MRFAPTLATLLTAVALLSACGGDDSGDQRASRAPGTPANPVPATPGVHEGSEGATTAKPSYGKLVQRQGKDKAKTGNRFTPCNLVTQVEAQRILNVAVQEPKEAPLGPTCLYRSRDGRSFVTLAVQSHSLAAATKALPGVRRLRVAGRPAACASTGRATLWVAAGKRRLLTVAGPCATAEKFAATALGHLAG